MSMSRSTSLDSTTHYTDEQWVVDICDTLVALSAAELDLKDSHPLCICEVPESLTSTMREDYIPQFVGLGPYHHFREGLVFTDHQKLAAARRVLRHFLPRNSIDLFQHRISKFDTHIQTFFHPDVASTYNLPTLSYVLTIDGLFVLAFITLLKGENRELGFSYFLTGKLGMPLFNDVGRELTVNALIREVFKLENQIPFYVFKQISGVNNNEINSDSMSLSLATSLKNFCKRECPFVNLKELPDRVALEGYYHLLDLMYHLVVPNHQSEPVSQPDSKVESEDEPEDEQQVPAKAPTQVQGEDPAVETETKAEDNVTCFSVWHRILLFLVATCIVIWFMITVVLKLFLWVINSIFRKIQRVLGFLFSVVLKVLRPLWGVVVRLGKRLNPALGWLHAALTKLEGKINHPILKPLTQVVGRLEVITATIESAESGVPRVVMIPSVKELRKAGILFRPAESGISSIDFDEKKCVFYLPCMRLDVNTEVIIRNLVAYETLIKSNTPLVFTRYVELMRAIIDTPEDVKILVDSEIIESKLKNEVMADIFNRTNKPIRATKTPNLDKVIYKVNAMFYSKEKHKRVVSKYTSGSFLTAIGGLLFLGFTALQTYCTVLNCSSSSRLAQFPTHFDHYGRNHYFISSF
ncbi:hypothetical protein V8G54_028817 [Vigna mungo]|uniref:Uncharacterized protein n=1 Tax=Vigna mungo TaxID=3915 RepID=A0AAQ3MTA6_VIGMU